MIFLQKTMPGYQSWASAFFIGPITNRKVNTLHRRPMHCEGFWISMRQGRLYFKKYKVKGQTIAILMTSDFMFDQRMQRIVDTLGVRYSILIYHRGKNGFVQENLQVKSMNCAFIKGWMFYTLNSMFGYCWPWWLKIGYNLLCRCRYLYWQEEWYKSEIKYWFMIVMSGLPKYPNWRDELGKKNLVFHRRYFCSASPDQNHRQWKSCFHFTQNGVKNL